MADGVYSIPRELKDEDKWLKFFTKTQLMIFGIGVLIVVLFGLILIPFRAYHLLTVLGVIVLTIFGVLAFVPMPPSRYLYGGGFPLYIIVLRILNKMISKKKLYLKNYEPEDV